MEEVIDIDIQTYERIPFEVQAVQVTAENVAQVAQWCEGDVQGHSGPNESDEHRHVVIKNKAGFKLRAFPGDWVAMKGKSVKVYPDRAFQSTFQLPSGLTDEEIRIAAGAIGIELYDGVKLDGTDRPDLSTIEEPSEQYPEGSECPYHKIVHSAHGWYVCVESDD